MQPAEVERRVLAGIWEPEYLPYRAMSLAPQAMEIAAAE